MRDFIAKWEQGADVVIGIKSYGKHETWFKRFSSEMFYKLLGAISRTIVTPHASDYRLIDKKVLDAFRDFNEHNRMTRGLIDWLGFRREYVDFEVAPRRHGERKYTWRKLVNLAMDNFTAYSLVPLKLAGYIGTFILIIAGLGGVTVYIDQVVLHDPLHLKITGTAMLGLMLLFLVGIVLACLGLIAMYIAHIHDEVVNRPLYIIRDQVDSEFAEDIEASGEGEEIESAGASE
jgi:dolichol-phosphate mannosyltransferase